jgi:hypothetical protein
LADGSGRSVRFAARMQPLCWNFLYHSSIILSVGGSVWYLVRNLRFTITIVSGLANSRTQNAFLTPVLAMFRRDCPLPVEPAKYVMVPDSQTNLERFSTYWYDIFCCIFLECCAVEFGRSGGTYELLCTSDAISSLFSLAKLITFQLTNSSYTLYNLLIR